MRRRLGTARGRSGFVQHRIPILFVLVVLATAVGACATATTLSTTLLPPNSSESMAGKSVEQRLQALEALSRTSKATIYYPGDPYAGMSIVSIDTADLAGNGAYAMNIQYASESSDRVMTVMVYTDDQYARAHVVPTGPPVTVVPHSPSDFVFGPLGAPSHNLLQSVRPGAVIVVTANPGMSVSQLVDVAEQLTPVPR
jgi:hypothetical protein